MRRAGAILPMRRLNVGSGDEAVGRVVDVPGRMTPRRPDEVVIQLGVHLVEGRLHGVDRGLKDVLQPADDLHRVALGEDERLASRDVDVGREDLGRAVRARDVADEQLVGLERHLGGCPDGRRRPLADDDLEGFVATEEDLLRVAVGARVAQQSLETQKQTPRASAPGPPPAPRWGVPRGPPSSPRPARSRRRSAGQGCAVRSMVRSGSGAWARHH